MDTNHIIFWSAVWLVSLVIVWEIGAHHGQLRGEERGYRKGEQSGFLEGVKGERRFHEEGRE